MTFFDDFKRLYNKQPHIAVHGYQNQNCPYGDFLYLSKNSYLCFDSDDLQDCGYVDMAENCRTSYDNSFVRNCELCYQCVDSRDCYNCDFCQECKTCSDCKFCYDCVSCQNCFACVGLRRKQYCFLNEQLTKEEYEKRMAELDLKDPQVMADIGEKFLELQQKTPRMASRQLQTENCTGHLIENCQNVVSGFNVTGCQDSGYLDHVYNVYGDRTSETYDVYHAVDLELCYQIINVGKGYNCNFCYYCEHISNSEYCEGVFNSKYMFGCVYRNHAEYEILNKKYEPDEWHRKVKAIKEQMRIDGEYGLWPNL